VHRQESAHARPVPLLFKVGHPPVRPLHVHHCTSTLRQCHKSQVISQSSPVTSRPCPGPSPPRPPLQKPTRTHRIREGCTHSSHKSQVTSHARPVPLLRKVGHVPVRPLHVHHCNSPPRPQGKSQVTRQQQAIFIAQKNKKISKCRLLLLFIIFFFFFSLLELEVLSPYSILRSVQSQLVTVLSVTPRASAAARDLDRVGASGAPGAGRQG